MIYRPFTLYKKNSILVNIFQLSIQTGLKKFWATSVYVYLSKKISELLSFYANTHSTVFRTGPDIPADRLLFILEKK